MSDGFEAALLNHIAPRLQPLGYRYDARLRLDDELFGFCKPLANDLQAVIQFQRHSNSTLDNFTINLIRARASEIEPGLRGGKAVVSAARLSYILWFVYGLRDYPTSDYWWAASNVAQREAALLDAAARIERYGAPWLESPDAPKPWEMPVQRADEFARAVQAVMASDLEHLGYYSAWQSLPGNLPYCFFGKAMPDGTFALIEPQSIYSVDPSEFSFDVRLQRRVDSDPLNFNGDYAQWRSMSLAQLVWQARCNAPLDRSSVSEAKTLFWRYRNRAELDSQLRDALEQIKQLGCVWVEQVPAPPKVIQ